MKRFERTKVEKKIKRNFFSFIICIHATNDPFDDDEKGYKSSLPQFIEFRDGARLMNRRFTGVRGLMNLKSNYPRDECLLLMFIANQSAVLSVFPSVDERWCDEIVGKVSTERDVLIAKSGACKQPRSTTFLQKLKLDRVGQRRFLSYSI